jgi:hypothetical protein
MTPLRRMRLLELATHPSGDHKSHYLQYCQLINEGLVRWTIGFASLTDKGTIELNKLKETK